MLIERAKGVWSFSHLTFQEYFAAKFIVDSGSPEIIFQHLVGCVREPHRLREVFLLATNMLDRKNIDSLLKSIKAQIDNLLIGDEKLQDLLRWITRKSFSLNLPYKSAAIRAFYLYSNLSLSLVLSPDIQHWVYLPLVRDIEPILGDKSGNNLLGLDANLLTAYVRAYLSAYWTAYEDPRVVRYSPYLGADFLNIVLTKNLNGEDESSIQLKRLLQDLLDQVPVWDGNFNLYSQWWQENHISWSEQLKAIILEYRDVGVDWQLNNEQKQRMRQYYDSNKLLIDCLNSGCNVSSEVRQKIEETLLLPIEEIEQ
ncbi:MAG: hypothetical protein HYR94_21540 [Chloroflexi bacterium]|nr:hypothetical protein [Chloroflexota bacterium]